MDDVSGVISSQQRKRYYAARQDLSYQHGTGCHISAKWQGFYISAACSMASYQRSMARRVGLGQHDERSGIRTERFPGDGQGPERKGASLGKLEVPEQTS